MTRRPSKKADSGLIDRIVGGTTSAGLAEEPTFNSIRIAAADSRVHKMLEELAQRGFVSLGPKELDPGLLLFEFAAPPGTVALHRPSFLVDVDLGRETVRDIRAGPPGRRTTPASLRFSVEEGLTVPGAIRESVAVKVEGGFRRAYASVDQQEVRLFEGTGRRDVDLLPPTVDVALTLWARNWTKYRLTVTINGRTKTESDTVPGGKTALSPLKYPFGDFGLAVPADGGGDLT